MIVRKAFKYRIYPNREQQAALAVQFGHARYIYNWGVRPVRSKPTQSRGMSGKVIVL